jgi:SAM-dependent methyltransferase
MFELTADLYDLIYSHKDYAAESDWVRTAIRARVPEARTLLDVACGTGAHLEHLRADFDCRGIDLNARFVEIAHERTGIAVSRADMDDFDLGERFDAVVCLFSAIGYSADVNAAVASMGRHVAPGGVLIVEPWFTPDEWIEGHVGVLDHEADGTRVVRMGTSARDGNVAVMEMHHLIGTAAGTEHVVEAHRLTLFTFGEYEAAFRNAGLSYELERPGPFGRGALIGRPEGSTRDS